MLSDYLYEFDSTDLANKNCGPCSFAIDNVIWHILISRMLLFAISLKIKQDTDDHVLFLFTYSVNFLSKLIMHLKYILELSLSKSIKVTLKIQLVDTILSP